MKALRIPAKIRAEKLKQCPFCVCCHTDKDLELNHVNPDLPPTIDNLMVLCSKCHMEKWHLEPTTRRHADMVRRGIKEAKERGVHFGKPHADYEHIMQMIAEHNTMFANGDWTKYEIMEACRIESVTYHKCQRMLLEDLQKDEWQHKFEKPVRVREKPLYPQLIERLRKGHESVSEYGLMYQEGNAIYNKRIFTGNETALLLGINQATLKSWVDAGEVKPTTIGSKRYFTQKEILRVLNEVAHSKGVIQWQKS